MTPQDSVETPQDSAKPPAAKRSTVEINALLIKTSNIIGIFGDLFPSRDLLQKVTNILLTTTLINNLKIPA